MRPSVVVSCLALIVTFPHARGSIIATTVNRTMQDSHLDWLFPPEVVSSGQAMLFAQSPLKYRHLGNPTEVASELELIWMTSDDMDVLCKREEMLGEGGKIKGKFKGKAVLVDEKKDFTCKGDAGSIVNYEFIPYWCSLGAAVIIRGNRFLYPGLFANEHDGTKFEKFFNKDESLRQCWWLQVQYDFSNGQDIPGYFEMHEVAGTLDRASRVFVHVETDVNHALDFFGHPAVVFFTRVFLPCLYLFTGILSLKYLIARYRSKSFNVMHMVTLSVNFVSAMVLAWVESQGNKFTTDNLSNAVNVFFYTVLFSSSVATDFLIACQYQLVRNKVLGEKRETVQRLFLFRFTAGFLFVLDFVINFGLMSITGNLLRIMQFLTPSISMILQLLIIVYLVRETFRMTKILKSIVARVEGAGGELDQAFLKMIKIQKRVESRLRFWVQVSMACAGGNLCLYFFIASKVIEKHPVAWVVFWLCFNLCVRLFLF